MSKADARFNVINTCVQTMPESAVVDTIDIETEEAISEAVVNHVARRYKLSSTERRKLLFSIDIKLQLSIGRERWDSN